MLSAADPDRLYRDVETLAGAIGERNVPRYGALCDATHYLVERLRGLGYEPELQTYPVDGRDVSNVEAEIPGSGDEIVVVGAHYDSVRGSPGANDNASGVASLLHLAEALRGAERPKRTLRFVAFVNEEPPYFQTSAMGSRVYARRCRERKERVVGMLSLETMGCFSDEPGSQRYPFPLSLFYPDTANFIALVANRASKTLLGDVAGAFREPGAPPFEAGAFLESIPGVGWSDQWAFWKEGYPGLMVTDTAPYRYPHYHTAEDTPDKVDYPRLAQVSETLARAVRRLSEQDGR